MLNVKSDGSQLARMASIIRKNKKAVLAALLIICAVLLLLVGGKDESGAEVDELEARLEEMCSSLSGVGSCRVMVTYEITPGRYGSQDVKSVQSVAVVCKGADKVGVRRELTDMLSSLFGIGANRIHISKMK